MELYVWVSLGWLLYFVGRWIYRAYLSPLAKFPGPKLAAATRLYEGYYDIVLRGQFKAQVDKLHEQYGVFELCAYH